MDRVTRRRIASVPSAPAIRVRVSARLFGHSEKLVALAALLRGVTLEFPAALIAVVQKLFRAAHLGV